MPEQKKVEDMSEVEIKAILYDQLTILNQSKRNIQILESELEKRSKKDKPETAEIVE
jgi:hypothetical protein